MTNLKRFYSQLLGVSNGEFSGFKWMVFIAVVCGLGLFLVNSITKNPYNNLEQDSAILDSLLVLMEQNEISVKSTAIQPDSLFKFDPNTAGIEKLITLGFPNWLATRLINYRSKGGNFRSKKDLLKLYGFPEELYNKISPYISIAKKDDLAITNRQPKDTQRVFSMPTKTLAKAPPFDLNIADTAMLQTIKGIGSVLSNRIVSYRQKLGGFINQEQLYEVYNLDSATIFELMKIAFISDMGKIRPIEINKIDEKELASHPYISWKQAKLIVAYRNQHGSYAAKEDLLNVYLLNNEWLEKIEPYISF